MKNLELKIDKNKCIHCGLCIKDCSCSVLEFDENIFPKVAKNGEQRCMECQHCFAICPTGALSILGLNPENSFDAPTELSDEEILKTIQSRKSTRQLKQENVDKEALNKLKEMLKWVPTGCNDHRLMFSFIEDIDMMKDYKKKVYGLLNNFYKNTCAEKEQNRGLFRIKEAVLKGSDVIFREAPHMVCVAYPKDSPCGSTDSVIALGYFELYANTLGLGTIWCGLSFYTLQAFPELLNELKIPEGYNPGYCMLFGKPAIKYKRITQPKPYKTVSYNKMSVKIIAFLRKLKNKIFNL